MAILLFIQAKEPYIYCVSALFACPLLPFVTTSARVYQLCINICRHYITYKAREPLLGLLAPFCFTNGRFAVLTGALTLDTSVLMTAYFYASDEPLTNRVTNDT